jgi:two-component system, NarL family, sensor histidine kinase DesK
MLTANRMLLRALVDSPFLTAADAGELVPHYRARMLTASRSSRSRTRELAPAATRDIVRSVAAIAVAVTVWLSIIDIWRVAYEAGQRGGVREGVLLAAIAIPLHLRHLLYGVRGEQPPYGEWTLGLLALVTFSGVYFVGSAWIFEFAPLVVSIMIVMRGRVALICAAIVVLSPLALVSPHWYGVGAQLSGLYLAMAIAWRSVTQFVPLRLLASIRALDVASRELEARAVVQARVRIDGELRTSVGPALQQIIARGEAARGVVQVNSAHAGAELRRLVTDSRRALAQARRIVAGYRVASVRGEIDAATALLEATGASVTSIVDDNVNLDAPDEHARAAIRSSLARALRDEPRQQYVVRVARQDDGTLEIDISDANAVAHARRVT